MQSQIFEREVFLAVDSMLQKKQLDRISFG